METLLKTAFARDVEAGLTAEKKYLMSRYFYDHSGDRIFQKIMRMPEYYLTDAELEIFTTQTREIIEAWACHPDGFDLVELGAGDGFKTKHLIKGLIAADKLFKYRPIDISSSVLDQLKENLEHIDALEIDGISGEYFDALKHLNNQDGRQKIILFLGSNIGNLTPAEAADFLAQIGATMQNSDALMVGFDLKKDPRLVHAAYDDPHGFTRDFNLNLLKRINRELGGNFDVEKFQHAPYYNPHLGRAVSYLVSTCEQTVHLSELNTSIHFNAWEAIHMEISQKFDLPMIHALAEGSGLVVDQVFTDSRGYYVNALLKRQSID